MSDERLDQAIDTAARQMTDGSPAGGADFRRRVLARIEAGGAPRRNWRASFVLSPLAVAAAIVVALLLARDRAVDAPKTVVPQEAARLKPDTTEAAAAVPLVARLSPLDGARGRQGRVRGAESLALHPSGLTAAPPVPALQLDSIAVARLTVDTLTTDSIQIERLDAVTPITVAPLDITDVQRRFE